MDIDCCNICGEDHSTEFCPELGLDISQIEFDQLSTRARLTLPQTLQVVDNGNGLVGVVAKETISTKTQFGPFEAKRTTHIFDDTGFFTLKLIGKDGATVCLDTTDENECNWMCLVRSAVSDDCMNCMAYQLGPNIFYSTTREITAGEELQVWYAPHFAKKLGKPVEPATDTRVLLGHRIEPLATDLFGDAEVLTAGQTDGQAVDEPTQQAQVGVGGTAELKRGEIKKAFYCPRCGNTFSSQTGMVQHLREHVLATTQSESPGPGKKRGRGRPRVHPPKVPEYPKRGRGRPRKSLANTAGITVDSTPDKAGQKRKRSDDDGDDEDFNPEDSDIDDAAEKMEAAELDGEDLDKDYSPMKELTSSGRRIQPRRSRKGRNSWLCEDYVVSKVGQKVRIDGNEGSVEEVEKTEEKPSKKASIVKAKTVTGDGKQAKRGRGRPRKIKDLVESTQHIIEIVNDAEPIDNTDGKVLNTDDEEIKGTEIKMADVGIEIEPDIDEIEPSENVVSEDTKVGNAETSHGQENRDIVNTEKDGAESSVVEFDPIVKGTGEVVLMYEESNDDMYGCVLCGEKFREEMEAVSHFMSHSRGSEKYKNAGNSTEELEAIIDEEGESSGAALEKQQQNFPCDICHQSFKSAQYLYRHMIMHTDIFSCVQCKKTFSRKDSLQKHVLKCCPHLAENYRIYSCDLCSRVFSTRTGHKKHLKKCKTVRCSECLKVFSSSQGLETHTCRKDDNDDVLLGRFSCGICPKTFQSMYYLIQHIMLHDKLYSCSRCAKSLPSKEDLEEHKVLCQTLEAIKVMGLGKCDKCDEEFNNAKTFREHYQSHSHPYQCDKCLRRFVKVGTLSSHDCQSGSDHFVCGVCSKTFKNRINLDRHIKEHGCMKYECSECSEQFHVKSHAKNHMCNGQQNPGAKIVATSDTREVCHACGKSFSTKSNLTKHMLLHGEKNFACPHCEKRFHLDVYLKDHITCVHYNIYKYQCTQCGKMLKSKTGLIAHTKLFHSTNVEAHPCPKCGKIFKQKGNLRTHMFSHSTERKFSCTECIRSFKYPDQLSRHKLEHKHVNKLSCPECDKTFYRGYEMKKHMQIYHSGYVYVCGICSSRCGHRHTLVRHYKRKHVEDFHLLSQEGYIDGLLKHVNDIYPNVGTVQTPGLTVQTQDMSMQTQGITVQAPDIAVQTQGIALQGQSIIIRNTLTNEDDQQVQEVVSTPEMLSRDAAEALHSLALGTVTAKQYQILKDKGLFSDALPPPGMPAEEVTMVTDHSVVSEDNNLIQSQEVLSQEQVVTDSVPNLSSVAMDASVGMVQNKDGTISIRGIQGIPQSLEGLENAEGQIVILQIVDPEGHEVSGIVQGEIIQQLQTGGILQANQEIIQSNQEEVIQANQEEIIQANHEEIIQANQKEIIRENPAEEGEDSGTLLSEEANNVQTNVLKITEENTVKTEEHIVEVDASEQEEVLGEELTADMHVSDNGISTVLVEQDNSGQVRDSSASEDMILDTEADIANNQTTIQYLQQGQAIQTHHDQAENSDQLVLTETSATQVLSGNQISAGISENQSAGLVVEGAIISAHLSDNMHVDNGEITAVNEDQEEIETDSRSNGILQSDETNRLLPKGEVIQIQSKRKVIHVPSIVEDELLD